MAKLQPTGAALLSRMIRTSFQKALERHDKVATGDTLRSIAVKKKQTKSYLQFLVYAGDGFKYTQWGKRANTKLPVYKEGGKFHLVKPLAAWKKALGLTMPDFLLARSIARKARAPVDLIGEAEQDIKTYFEAAIIKEIGFTEFFARAINEISEKRR